MISTKVVRIMLITMTELAANSHLRLVTLHQCTHRISASSCVCVSVVLSQNHGLSVHRISSGSYLVLLHHHVFVHCT